MSLPWGSPLIETVQQAPGVALAVVCRCVRCKIYHVEHELSPAALLSYMTFWDTKHPAARECVTDFHVVNARIPKQFDDRLYDELGIGPFFIDGFKHNTAFTATYRASGAVSNAIQSLATSSTWLAGYESATIDNTSNKDFDIHLSGFTTVGTTPTINTRIEHNIVTMDSDTTWPDVFDGTESAETVTSQGVKDGICTPIVFLNVDATTSNRVYGYRKTSIGVRFGFICPPKSGVFTTHNTGVNLNSTAGNQSLVAQGTQVTGT